MGEVEEEARGRGAERQVRERRGREMYIQRPMKVLKRELNISILMNGSLYAEGTVGCNRATAAWR